MPCRPSRADPSTGLIRVAGLQVAAPSVERQHWRSPSRPPPFSPAIAVTTTVSLDIAMRGPRRMPRERPQTDAIGVAGPKVAPASFDAQTYTPFFVPQTTKTLVRDLLGNRPGESPASSNTGAPMASCGSRAPEG